MAVLNKIRQRSLFLILIIALALFAFVLTDLFRNSDALFGQSQDVVATVNGDEIGRQNFMMMVENAQRNQGPNSTSTQTMNRIYEQEVRKLILEDRFEELGLSVEEEQMKDLLKQNFSSYPDFQNQDGIFDEAKLTEFIANLKAIRNTPQNAAPLGNFQITYDQWISNEKAIAQRANEQTYYNMIKAGVNATLVEGKVNYIMENETVDLKYAYIPYTSIADSLVEVSKSDIVAFMKKQEEKYKVDETRDIVYVEFKEEPTLEDENQIKNDLIKLIDDRQEFNKVTKNTETVAGFKNTKDVEEFVNSNSDIKYIDRFLKKSALPQSIADTIFKLNVGDIYGPYKEEGYFKLTKLVATKALPDSVKTRHILIPYLGAASSQGVTRSKEEAKTLADSLANVVKTDRSKFSDLAKDFSSDPGSKDNGGEYDYHPYNQMVPEFNDFEFENKVGDVGVVETVYGYHIIEILGQKGSSNVVKVATIAHKIEPSEETIDNVFNTTSKFEVAVQDAYFEDVAKENGYTVKPVTLKELDENIPGLGSQRTIVRWAYEDGTKVGDYKRFSIPSGGYAVVQLVNIKKAGLMAPEDVSPAVITEIRNEKKAKLIREKISGTTVEEVAKNSGVPTRNAASVNMSNPTLSGAGREPKVVGYAFGMKEGEVSQPIDGVKGVFVLEVSKKTPAPELNNYQPSANRLSATRSSSVITKAYNALKEAADIEDNRAMFY